MLLPFQSNPKEVEVIPLGHASLLLKWNDLAVYIDPTSQWDYTGLPQGDLILITDIHGDHLDLKQIQALTKPGTTIAGPIAVQETVAFAEIIRNGETKQFHGIPIEAIPAYNLERGPEEGRFYHPKGRGNGYVLDFGGLRVYLSGDTECTAEMKNLKEIDIAFICMNLPYTMPPEEAGACIQAFKPSIVYPYHYRGSDLQVFRDSISNPETEVRILDWYPAKP